MTRLRTFGFVAGMTSAACIAALACADTNRRPRSAPQRTAVVRSGVAAAAIPSVPELCGSGARVTCIRDTTFAHDVDYDPGILVEAHWIWFGTAGDSVEVYTEADSTTFGRYPANVTTDFGEEQDEKQNTASYVRRRLPRGGVFTISVGAAGEVSDSGGYMLAVRDLGPGPARQLRPTGAWARLVVASSGQHTKFTIIPLSIADSAHDRSNWTAPARTYKVELLPDSLYEICRVPCVRPDTLKLLPFTTTRWRD